jgi:hypothetical protein
MVISHPQNVGLLSPQSFNSFSWGHLPATPSSQASRGNAQYGRSSEQFRDRERERYNPVYSGQSAFDSYPVNSRYEMTGYGSKTQERWDCMKRTKEFPTWDLPASEEDVGNAMTFRTSSSKGIAVIHHRKKHVPLNRQRVPDSEVDQGVYKSLHQDVMRFSTELNPVYAWKAQPEDAQNWLRERVADAYEFEGPVTLNESWLSSEVSDGIGRNKFKLRTYIRGGAGKATGSEASILGCLSGAGERPRDIGTKCSHEEHHEREATERIFGKNHGKVCHCSPGK